MGHEAAKGDGQRMVVEKEELGRRLRAAREACGMTQDEVARDLGVSRSTIAQIELGNRPVTSLDLSRLADVFGRDMRELLGDSFRSQDTIVALFRAEPDVREQKQIVDALRKCVAVGRELSNLEQLLGIERIGVAPATYSLPTPTTKWDAIQQADHVAAEERRRLGLGWLSLRDMNELLEAQGVRTGLIDLPDDVSGLTLTEATLGLFVVANRKHAPLRQRFSFAHEYAHVLLDRARRGVVSRAADRDNLLEVRANAFAAAFLMPTEGVQRFVNGLGKGRASRGYAEVFDEADAVTVEGRTQPYTQEIQLYDVAQLAHHFGVSRVATIYRLGNLGLAKTPHVEALKAEEDAGKGATIARAMELAEPDAEKARNAFRQRFVGLALEAVRREEITRAKATELAAMVGVSGKALAALLTDTGLDEPT